MNWKTDEGTNPRPCGDGGPAPGATAESHRRGQAIEVPEYLRRYYRWAYLWPVSVWLFDHQPIINAILLGQYGRIMDQTLRLVMPSSTGRVLQIAAVYGKLTPTLAARIPDLQLIDAAPVQLAAARRKLDAIGVDAVMACMDAEELEYENDSFDAALMYLLLHEMPAEARDNSLREALRVLRPGGKLIIAEYGELGRRHPLHRLAPFRWVLTRAEPFLDGFWRRDLTADLERLGAGISKRISLEEQVDIFGGFYRVMRYRIESTLSVWCAPDDAIGYSPPARSRYNGYRGLDG